MSDEFKIEFDWLPRDHGSAIDKATLAELAICVAGHSVTRLEDKLAKTIRDRARLSAYDLAAWFASNWWRLRWEPEGRGLSWLMSHHLGSVGGGYVWPNATFSSDGESLLIRAHPTTSAETIRYLSNIDLGIPVSNFETGVDEFLARVIARLSDVRINNHELSDLWREVLSERRDVSVAKYRKLEAMLGYDPDTAPNALIDGLLKAESSFGTNAVEEIAAASKEAALVNLDQIRERGIAAATKIEIPQLEELTAAIRERNDPTNVAWQRAATAAQVARKTWGFKSGPISTPKLAELFGFDPSLIDHGAQGTVPIEVGFRTRNKREKLSVALRRRHPQSRRFALTRLVADHIDAAPQDRLLPVTKAKTQRQKFQRSFAQEFLCPFAELMKFVGDHPDDDGIEEAADHYDVSPLLVSMTLVNKGVIERSHGGKFAAQTAGFN